MRDIFSRTKGELCMEKAPLAALAERYGTPLYVYSRAALEQGYQAYAEALQGQPHLVCYAVKANSNIALLSVLARLGCGFDIVSGGELARVRAAGGDPQRVVFSGVGKTAPEMAAALRAGILCFNVESLPELQLLEKIAAREQLVAGVGVRVNPDIDAGTHPHIATGVRASKFGLAPARVRQLCECIQASPWLRLETLSCHIGSQILQLEPFLEALDFLLAWRRECQEQGLDCPHLDIGGGLGIRYQKEAAPTPKELVDALRERLAGTELRLILEPGRSVAAAAGVLVTRVLYLKKEEHGNFAIVDAAMNDLLRPALYDARMELVPLLSREGGEECSYQVVGPVCESADFLARDRRLALCEGDFLAVLDAGAYSFCMSSNYNSRVRAAEVMVDGEEGFLVRQRESVADLMRGEALLPDAVLHRSK